MNVDHRTHEEKVKGISGKPHTVVVCEGCEQEYAQRKEQNLTVRVTPPVLPSVEPPKKSRRSKKEEA
jgi:hypothetical protein